MVTRKSPAVKAAANKAGRRRVVGGASAPSYFASGSDREQYEFVSSGSQLIDCALSGGWVLGRVSNIVGDKSAGKTLLAMEALANFHRSYPDGWSRYAESEHAFDEPYADALGIPTEKITFNKKGVPLQTIEELYDDLDGMLEKNKGKPGFAIVDSLDAFSDNAEMDRDFGAASYGGTKPKAMGELFRRLVGRLQEQRAHLMIISQLKDKIGVSFGETKTRSGGKALDYYSTHIMWLAQLGMKKRTVNGIERVVGLDVEGYVKKNKIGLAFRKAKYPLLFGYGIDDMQSLADWLKDIKKESELEKLGISPSKYTADLMKIRNAGGAEAHEMSKELGELVRKHWQEIETSFLPTSKKY